MAFCIECGAKAPDVAKFCPQCGMALVAIESAAEVAPDPIIDTAQAGAAEIETPEISQNFEAEALDADVDAGAPEAKPEEIETPSETIAVKPAAIDTAPSPEASLAAAASVVGDAPKSKAGLFAGVAVVAVLAAIGGAYAMGLFGGGDKETETLAKAPDVTAAAALPDTDNPETETPGGDPVLTAYKNAIKTGRISGLGQFAKDNPKSSLAKDAETAAFESLQRQNSVLAFKTFTEYFPEADTAAYTGPRNNLDDGTLSGDPVGVEIDVAPVAAPSIRTSITERTAELEPFIEQGNVDYALSVIDEIIDQTSLTDQEATYLLNLRARAETSRGLAVPAQVEVTQPDPAPAENFIEVHTCWDGSIIEVSLACPAIPEATVPAAETLSPAPATEAPSPEAPLPTAPSTTAESPPEISPELPSDLPYDTAAKPIERFGAITPDAATEPGECDMAFSIDTSGSPKNIIASCTAPLFIEPAKETVSEWTYSPALLNGAPVQQDGVVVKIKFHLE